MSASASESPVRGMDAETRLVGVALQEKSNKKYSKLKVAFDHGKCLVLYTVEPHYYGHPRDWAKFTLMER